MSKCCGDSNPGVNPKGTCAQATPPGCHGDSPGAGSTPGDWFANMIPNCLTYAKQAKEQGRPVVGIMCEYTPRELILAAGAVPVCLCGGSADTIPAAEEDLPANLCPLIKSTYGYLKQKSNPFIEMADLIYDVETYRIRRLAEQELGLPYLRIETDYSRSNAAQIAVRVEALLETVRGGACSPGCRS